MVYSSSDSFTFFWRPHEENGFLGQWFESPFEVGGVRYLTAEQFMMAEKARSKIQSCHNFILILRVVSTDTLCLLNESTTL